MIFRALWVPNQQIHAECCGTEWDCEDDWESAMRCGWWYGSKEDCEEAHPEAVAVRVDIAVHLGFVDMDPNWPGTGGF